MQWENGHALLEVANAVVDEVENATRRADDDPR